MQKIKLGSDCMRKKLILALAYGVTASMSMTIAVYAENERSVKIGGNVKLDITDDGGRSLLGFAGAVNRGNGDLIKGVAQSLVLFNPYNRSILIEHNTEQSVMDNSSVTVAFNSVEVDDLFL